MLLSWPLAEQRAFFEAELRMPLALEADAGKLFPSSQRARDVRDGLVARVREAGARTWFGARVGGLERGEAGAWPVALDGAPSIEARAVIVATGGLSVPNTGSDGGGLAIVRALGHEVSPTYPALTPLTAAPHPHEALAGVSTDVTLTAPGSKPAFSTSGALLITHRGWSGPAVLDASHHATRTAPDGGRQEILVNWTGRASVDWDRELREGTGNARSVVAARLPRRLAEALLLEAGVPLDTLLAQLRRAERARLVETLTAYPLPWTGHEGYQKAEVTGGGVALGEVDPRTMESRRVPGLDLCGEILDAFGPFGGHNFLWAWATGRAAGASV
jgi:predicted Rossmann fold flavoprotein